ncbi:DUF3017 domain-containing protein [Actinomycetospora termitidis]|uniref:DUF3017 domain-containing protein n=1 Tax=Actinomycetospora termitidis TaxID=3053470 RepID=A0ABT7M4G9_9PSEU|nr:DUF3017 domain-containing protein [Actinomycetospora sp. Odt1-22]MDL5155554.1 DUF3017 domain-containing protein [Actinomycetospora sp. Odt1-22]
MTEPERPDGPDPASGTTTDVEDADSLPLDDSNDALPHEGPRHARPPRTVGDYARALLHRLRAQAALASVLAVLVVGFVRIALQHWRDGTTIVGIALLLAAVLRVALPDRTVGLLAVRPRRTDVLTYALFGAVVILLSLTITGGPLTVR